MMSGGGDGGGNKKTNEIQQLRELQQMQNALELLEENLGRVSVDGGAGGSVSDVVQLQEQMEMLQGVMSQLGEIGPSSDNNDLGNLSSAMISSLNRKMEELSGGPTFSEVAEGTSGVHAGASSEEKEEDKSLSSVSLDDIMILFKSHGLDMDRTELESMLNTEQGVQLVQQLDGWDGKRQRLARSCLGGGEQVAAGDRV